MNELIRTPDHWQSPYGPKKTLVAVPKRMCWMHPKALASWHAELLIVTDIYRSLTVQLEAYESGRRGVQQPGYSAHNFGLAIDLDVAAMMKLLDCDKAGLDAWMSDRGWVCYREDHEIGRDASENWHFTFEASRHGPRGVEDAILKYYAEDFRTMRESPEMIQATLYDLKLYDGEIDGKLGPLSKRAVRLFQRQWKLSVDGKVGKETARMLVAARLMPA